MSRRLSTDEGTITATEVLYYAYDASGLPMSVTLTDATDAESTYYYAVNIQSDVVAILNTSGTAVVEYTYDAWGNPLAVTGTLADTLGKANSLRYRGYVYDNETGYYYLRSRYYNPELGRFINADVYTSTGQGLLGNNMFSYCLNNPIAYTDSNGKIAIFDDLAICLCVLGVCAVIVLLTPPVQTALFNTVCNVLNEVVNVLSTAVSDMARVVMDEADETLPQQGLVEGDPNAPPVNAGKQGKHVPGHNNYDAGKSSWPEGQTGVQQTQEAWMNGEPDPKKPDGSVRIGTAFDGTTVRVHIDSTGAIHGYPLVKFMIVHMVKTIIHFYEYDKY